MKAELWRKIDKLFAAAQSQAADERAAFLDRVCEGDPELRVELESLLRAADSADSFFEHPPAALQSDRPALKAGDALGAFEIVERIGRGGMGEVYRARDARLRRSVAIKVLPPEFAQDGERLRRFEREARAASALNHPNIVAVFDVGHEYGINWIVTELVEGRSLRQALAKGPIAPRKGAEIAAQIADGLAAAHAAGLVHRDLKAENVMLAKPDDLVKILDFGIAKWQMRDATAETVTNTLTCTGEIVGTPASMSPEQAEGRQIDHRSDIFSLGVVLYEMLSGQRPFTGDTHAALMHAIVNQEPQELPSVLPEAITGIVRRCLEKLPERRFQAAADLAYALRLVGGAQPRVESQRARKGWPIVAAVAAAIVLLAGSAYWWLRPQTNQVDLHPIPLMSWPGRPIHPTFSPDGDKIAFGWNSEKQDRFHIYVEHIGSVTRPRQLTAGPYDDFCPAWSPDDRYIAFLRAVGSDRALMLVPSLGGPERRVADFPAGSGACLSWTPDSEWVAASVRDAPQTPYSIWLVSVATGERRRLSSPPPGRVGDWWPSISPNGHSLAFAREVRDFRFAPHVLSLSQDYRPEGEPQELTGERYAVMDGTAWTADSHAIIFSAGSPFSASLHRAPASGSQIPARLPYVLPDAVEPAISPTRARLVYSMRNLNENLWRLDTRTGERRLLVGSNGYADFPQYSPDGRRLAFQSNRSGEMGVWTCDADGSNCVQLTSFGKAQGGAPRWSPDGQWIAFDSRLEGQSDIYIMQADGGSLRRMPSHPADDVAPSWSRDGRWVYFASDRSGRMETWKMPTAGGAAVQVTHAGGGPAFESADGKHLYYTRYSGYGGGNPGPLFRIPVGGGPEVQVLPRVADWSSFGVAAKGIYFTPDGRTIQHLELSSGRVSTLTRVVEDVDGLCVSPDGAFVVWSQIDRWHWELMLVEGFR